MRAALIGFGRAGRIHMKASEGVIDIVSVVDEQQSTMKDIENTVHTTRELEDALQSAVDMVIVASPTKTHYSIAKAALKANKHVFVEKPIAQTTQEIEELYELARAHNRVLFTAYNRRYDTHWTKWSSDIKTDPPLCINIVCRDHPFPPAAYLESCGGIFRDAAVHDIDMVCHALTDTPIRVHAVLDDRKESACTDIEFSGGCRARFVHSRHSLFYDQRAFAITSSTTYEMKNTSTELGVSFADRYADSYVVQLRAFRDACGAKEAEPNVSIEHARMITRIIRACDESARTGSAVELQPLRRYERAHQRVMTCYRTARTRQTVDHVRAMRVKHLPGRLSRALGIWDVFDELEDFVDLSDPDVELPNTQHALQTAESLRGAGAPDWLQLIGFIHDFGKMLVRWGEDADGTSTNAQWSVVGDTFVVGCALPEELIYPEFNSLSEYDNSTTLGIYRANAGLDACLISYGHDEYLYNILEHSRTNLPKIALKIIRYHSLYAWHEQGAYTELASEEDELMKGWVKLFNSHDLYSKKAGRVDPEAVRAYYDGLAAKYLPNGLLF